MNRRTFLAGVTGGLAFLAGCITNQPSGTANDTTTGDSPEPSTTNPTPTPTGPTTDSTTVTSDVPRAERACKGTTFLSFYALGEDFAWDPDSVMVGFNLGAGAHVILVVYENDRVLGTAQATAPSDVGVVVDGMPIPLNTRLSGEHTIRIVMYGDVNKNGRFDSETATPCRYEGNVIQTEPETIDFSAFSDDSTVTPRETGS